jgi:hypothetical protein
LLTEYKELFTTVFATHTFDAIIWNPVRCFFTPLLGASRESIHTEFDLAVALPLECIRVALQVPRTESKNLFILVSSISAFRHSENLASYGIVKNAQIKLAEMLSIEVPDQLICKVIAPIRIQQIPPVVLAEAFKKAIENLEPEQVLDKVFWA